MELYRLLKESSDNHDMNGENWTRISSFKDRIRHHIAIGNNVNYQCQSDNNLAPLHLASANGFLHAVEVLIDLGADTNIVDSRNQSPLMHASTHGQLAVVKYLVGNNAHIDKVDKFGCTALVRATLAGQLDIVEYLTEKGANIHIRNFKFGASALLEAAYWGRILILEHLLNNGALIEERDFDGRTSLYRAASIGHKDIIQLLVSRGADINAKARGKNNETPLHRAALHGHVPIIYYLVTHGANTDARTSDNLAPADMTRRNEKLSIEVKAKVMEYFKRKEEEDIMRSLVQKMQQNMDTSFDVDNKEFEKLLQKGHFNSHDYVFYLSGPCNVGKTTLASLLIDEKIPEKWESTNGIDILFGRCCINLTEKKLEPLQKHEGDEVYNKLIRGQIKDDVTLGKIVNKRNDTDLNDLEVDAKKVQRPCAREIIYDRQAQRPIEVVSNSVTVHRTTLQRLTSRKIQTNLLEKMRSGNFKRDKVPCDIVDFGGQRAFDTTHQLFIHHRGLILLMFNGSKDLNKNLNEYEENVTTICILQHWVDSILAYCTDESTRLPEIHFVATHSDLIDVKERKNRRQELIHQLRNVFECHKKGAFVL